MEMGEKKVVQQDFLKSFLGQQTHRRVNMLAGDLMQTRGPGAPGDAPDRNRVLMLDDFERTVDGKLQCSYCSYSSHRTARLMEHTRTHTGEKPHRCRLCPFTSAYERYLEAHMRSHSGEKRYKCELCAYRCNYGSNLSHHRRRKHNLLPLTGPRASISSVKMWGTLQNKGNVEDGKRGVLITLAPPSVAVQKPDQLRSDSTHKSPSGQNGFCDSTDKTSVCRLPREPQGLWLVDNPLNQLSDLAGNLSTLPPENPNPVSADVDAILEEWKPFVMQQPSAQGRVAQSSLIVLRLSPPSSQRICSPLKGPSSQLSGYTNTPILGDSQPSSPTATSLVQEPQLLYCCQHCDTYFADNVLYTIHMGCHGYDNPFQCNICGFHCENKYDFACHFARGQHN
ncbi:zinc finger protein Pegasus-like [Mus pahari]|uniref:zinc finger protein Pegasus-like n=1 Tax=Mus pahari TaxID=10093 RepID=UPI000A306ADB|nr:zinc finger protein Pegasus-like [Mus pahari]